MFGYIFADFTDNDCFTLGYVKSVGADMKVIIDPAKALPTATSQLTCTLTATYGW